ncbi:zinc ribbon domain-containing protein [Microcoleus sp. Pol7_A1]
MPAHPSGWRQSYRIGKSFKCGHCGWHGDADLNGAKMIKLFG